MARRPRLVLPDVPLHIIQRGNNRQACFDGESDHRVYLDLLRQSAKLANCAVHAYVLMSNHVHLLLSPADKRAPAKLMKLLGQRYVQYFNRRHGRSGTLWEGRYRSCLVQDERYLLVCQRYIELNPVRAGMVDTPADHPWSSFHANARGQRDPLITPHPIYQHLGPNDAERRASYRALFDQALPQGMLNHLRHASNGNYSFGSEQFEQAVLRAAGRPAVPLRGGRRPSTSVTAPRWLKLRSDPGLMANGGPTPVAG
jgi:putative transposase